MRRDVDRDVIQAWLDALSTGACDEEAFLRAVQKLARRSPEAGWDSLALIDQYYRRSKIPTEVFNSLKSRLGSELVGPGPEGDISVPLPLAGEPGIDSPPPPPLQRPAAKSGEPREPGPAAQLRSAAPVLSAAVRAVAAAAATPPAAAATPPAAAATPPAVAATPPAVAATPPAVAATPPTAAIPAAAAAAARVDAAPSPAPAAGGAATGAGHREMAITQPNASARASAPVRRAPGRDIVVGDVLRGRYAIKSILGRGGTGIVFEAADLYRVDLPESGQRVALKVLHSQVSGKPEQLTELLREFQLLQSLSHPNVVRAHDYDRDGDICFFTMEYLRGLSLTGVLSARNQVPLERAQALAIVRDVGEALAHAHSRGVVHGDLNPGNIFITNEGAVRVLDFGAAHTPSASPAVSVSASEHAPFATPRYASCQVLEGKRPDARDDVYALACVAYLLLSGKHPFGEKTALEAREGRLRPSRPAGLAWKEWRALRAGLAFDRERRPSDIHRWLEPIDWSKAAAGLPVLLAVVRVATRKRTVGNLPAVGLSVAIAVAAGWWAIQNPDSIERGLHQLRAALTDSGRPPPTSMNAPSAQAVGPHPEGRSEATAHAPASAPAVAASGAAAPREAAPGASRSATPTTAPPRTERAAGAATLAAGRNPSGAQTHSRIELAADAVEIPLTDPAARIIVRRRGSLRGAASFTWWTESGTAKPGRDFMAVAPRREIMEEGKSSLSLFIPVVGDATRRQPKSFYVVINDPGAGVSLGARTLTMVTIPPSL